MNDSTDLSAEERSAEENYWALKREVADRLRNSCSGWPSEEFDALIEKVTRIAMKYPAARREPSHNQNS